MEIKSYEIEERGRGMKRKKGIYEKYVKRPMDVTLSLLALIVLSPVMLIVAILVRIKLGSPVIFKQRRPGLQEKIFTLYKFRTMTDKKDQNGKLLPDSVRLTKFGKLLRSTSLDELPELWNIIKGDMSIVGPRP
ncbi:MAG: sugar transferase, partial [Lachnospiraceae bacterium]